MVSIPDVPVEKTATVIVSRTSAMRRASGNVVSSRPATWSRITMATIVDNFDGLHLPPWNLLSTDGIAWRRQPQGIASQESGHTDSTLSSIKDCTSVSERPKFRCAINVSRTAAKILLGASSE
jgi:hypothetical protein|tara:strand:- start:601 stop:969 length:369 start_codon:yes stop_codon:yes gene_type:complete